MRSWAFLLSRRWIGFAVVVALLAWGAWWLGEWQFGRLEERKARNAVIERNETLPPAPVADVLPASGDLAETDEWRVVTATGEYDESDTVIVRYRTRDGASGVEVVVPLVLEDGRTFRGRSYGATGTTVAEIVFNTGMTGYQETLTDPSYRGQIVVMTTPHVGNTGANAEDFESRQVWVDGYVVRDPARHRSNWRADRSLDELLTDSGVVGISGIDTRALTRHLRERGSMRAGISTELDAEQLLAQVTAAPEMTGSNYLADVTVPEAHVVPAEGDKKYTVVALDQPARQPLHLGQGAVGSLLVTHRAERVDVAVDAVTPQRHPAHRAAACSCLVRMAPR